MNQTCYMCEAEATSMEHVPPKCLFPESKDLPSGVDLRKNLIKVPSCDQHNSHKSLDDEYFMFVIASAFHGNNPREKHFDTKIMRAAKRRPYILSTILQNLTTVYLKEQDGSLIESAAFQVDVGRFENMVQHIACGIFYDHYKRKWHGGFRVYTNELLDLTSENSYERNDLIQKVSHKISTAFASLPEIGENKEIFMYKIFSDQSDRHAIHMVFYEGVEITVLLNSA